MSKRVDDIVLRVEELERVTELKPLTSEMQERMKRRTVDYVHVDAYAQSQYERDSARTLYSEASALLNELGQACKLPGSPTHEECVKAVIAELEQFRSQLAKASVPTDDYVLDKVTLTMQEYMRLKSEFNEEHSVEKHKQYRTLQSDRDHWKSEFDILSGRYQRDINGATENEGVLDAWRLRAVRAEQSLTRLENTLVGAHTAAALLQRLEQYEELADLLAMDGLTALAGAGICTSQEGFIKDPNGLARGIHDLARERDCALARVRELEGFLKDANFPTTEQVTP